MEYQEFSCWTQLDKISGRTKLGVVGVKGGVKYIHRPQNQLVVHLDALYLVYRDQYCILWINIRATPSSVPASVLLSGNSLPP